MTNDDKTDSEIVQAALEKLLDKSPLGKFVRLAVRSADLTTPATTLMHVGFKENLGNTLALADFLWTQALNYALTRKRREQIRARLEGAPPGDISAIAAPVNAARDAFIDFHKDYPSRASEVGEVLAYCIAVNELDAAQVAAKMSLKTSGNMPVHGLDGIHAKIEGGALYVFFLESKLSQSANTGVKDYAESVGLQARGHEMSTFAHDLSKRLASHGSFWKYLGQLQGAGAARTLTSPLADAPIRITKSRTVLRSHIEGAKFGLYRACFG